LRWASGVQEVLLSLLCRALLHERGFPVKRSQINQHIGEAITFFREHRFALPPFAYWTEADWQAKDVNVDEIRDIMLGWDITDFGGGNFEAQGLLLFTIRNGSTVDPRYPKRYAEKIMMVRPRQVTPCHFQWHKMEDIINRGGGNLMISLNNSLANGRLDTQGEVVARLDGRQITLPAGGTVVLSPGESITLPPLQYHSFWGQETTGPVMVGEVSQVNDDHSDNCFAVPMGRFPVVEEDEARKHLLCIEYPRRAVV
jgi:hypothetical protein